jgi:competence protein ComEA
MMKGKIAGKILKVLLVTLAISFIMGGMSFAEKSDSKAPVNINQATLKELTSLPGIGKKRAKDIIAYREQNGKFSNIEELKKVDGIGKDTLEKIKDHIVFE